jgi:CxxC motif-containing protein (DUF1111 family)
MRFLGPVEVSPSGSLERAGQGLFASIGCAGCHTPILMTAANRNPVFDRKAVALYSDLLLHDIGTGDGIVQASAGANEIRTPALWGLRLRRPLLHDGSAATPEEAILRHSVEAESIIKTYKALPEASRDALLAFLRSL